MAKGPVDVGVAYASESFTREEWSLISQGLSMLAASHKRRCSTEKDVAVRNIYDQLRVKAEALFIKVRGMSPVDPAPHS